MMSLWLRVMLSISNWNCSSNYCKWKCNCNWKWTSNSYSNSNSNFNLNCNSDSDSMSKQLHCRKITNIRVSRWGIAGDKGPWNIATVTQISHIEYTCIYPAIHLYCKLLQTIMKPSSTWSLRRLSSTDHEIIMKSAVNLCDILRFVRANTFVSPRPHGKRSCKRSYWIT